MEILTNGVAHGEPTERGVGGKGIRARVKIGSSGGLPRERFRRVADNANDGELAEVSEITPLEFLLILD